MLAAAEDADLVLGSRVRARRWRGGVADVAEADLRGGCAYARLVLGVPIRDRTGGFKCFRRWVLELLDLRNVRVGGYAFQIVYLPHAADGGGRVVELPITFTDRTLGNSKMSRSIVLEAVREVPALRLQAARGRLVEGDDGNGRCRPCNGFATAAESRRHRGSTDLKLRRP